MLDTQIVYDNKNFHDFMTDYNCDLLGVPPFLLYNPHQHRFLSDSFEVYYFSSDSPAEKIIVMKKASWLVNRILLNDIVIDYPQNYPAYPTRKNPAADFKNLIYIYETKTAYQIRDLIQQLDFKKVKLEQQAQFFQGLRFMNKPATALIGLQICLDAYDFEGWEFDWMNPLSYFNVVKGLMSVVLPFK